MTKPALNEQAKTISVESKIFVASGDCTCELFRGQQFSYHSDRETLLCSDSPAKLERETFLDSEEQLFSSG